MLARLFGKTKFSHSSSSTTAHPFKLRTYIFVSIFIGLVVASAVMHSYAPFAAVAYGVAAVFEFVHQALIWQPLHDALDRIVTSLRTFGDNLQAE